MNIGQSTNDTKLTEETSSTKKKNKHLLSEREIARVLIYHLEKLGYHAVTELVLNDAHLNIKKITGKNLTKVRIDVAAVKGDIITFIEVENGFWATHPLLYRNFAHRVFLAYPAESNTPTDAEQLQLAKSQGIGVIKVSTIGTLLPVLDPVDIEISHYIRNAIKSLIQKRLLKVK